MKKQFIIAYLLLSGIICFSGQSIYDKFLNPLVALQLDYIQSNEIINKNEWNKAINPIYIYILNNRKNAFGIADKNLTQALRLFQLTSDNLFKISNIIVEHEGLLREPIYQQQNMHVINQLNEIKNLLFIIRDTLSKPYKFDIKKENARRLLYGVTAVFYQMIKNLERKLS
jgi:hypothetical protein